MNGADSMSPMVPPSLNARLTTRRGQVPGRGYLDYTDISFFICLIHWNLRNTLNPILDRVRDMRYNLVGVLAAHVSSHLIYIATPAQSYRGSPHGASSDVRRQQIFPMWEG